ncbi:MAG: hypothetical protein ACOX3T_07390 [Bdellovibrionota bacterium]
MKLKKTQAELREMVQSWNNSLAETIKVQEGWKLLTGGVVLGIVCTLLWKIVLSVLFLLVVCALVLYFLSPKDAVSFDDDEAIIFEDSFDRKFDNKDSSKDNDRDKDDTKNN